MSIKDEDIDWREAYRQLKDAGWAHGYRACYAKRPYDPDIVRALNGSRSHFAVAALEGFRAAVATRAYVRRVRVAAALQAWGIPSVRVDRRLP